MSGKVFVGYADKRPKACVFVQDPGDAEARRLLPLRLDLMAHSPTGMGWGYGGSGPAQLALAMLSEVTTDRVALTLYQDFKWAVIARLPMDRDWTISGAEVAAFVASHKAAA